MSGSELMWLVIVLAVLWLIIRTAAGAALDAHRRKSRKD